MKLRYLLILFCTVLLISSCGRTDCITVSTSIGIAFNGYDFDTGVKVIVSQYAGSTNSAPVERDTFIIDSNILYREMWDSTMGRSLYPAGTSASLGYVTEVVVPSTGKHDIISGVEFTHDTRKKEFMEGGGWGNQCINVCTGYYLNGQHVATGYTAAVSYGGSVDAEVTLNKY